MTAQEELEKILESYYLDCNNIPTDGTIYDPIGVLTDNAISAILSALPKLGYVKKSEHCKDCCCAKSWEALGIKEFTGLSIPEEIQKLKKELFELSGGFR